MIDRQHITGLVLAGRLGRRLGSAEKSLAPYDGAPLARHALNGLAPQAGHPNLHRPRAAR